MIIRLLLSSRLPVNPVAVEFRVALGSISPVSRIQSTSRIIFQKIINDPSKERRDFLGKIIRSIKMDCFFFFLEKEMNARKRNRVENGRENGKILAEKPTDQDACHSFIFVFGQSR